MNFEWDEAKNKVNVQKHGIDFADVPQMFEHPMLSAQDTRREYGEERWIGIGKLRDLVAVVVFTEPDENTIRVISARKATRYEQQTYNEEIAD